MLTTDLATTVCGVRSPSAVGQFGAAVIFSCHFAPVSGCVPHTTSDVLAGSAIVHAHVSSLGIHDVHVSIGDAISSANLN